MPGQDTVEILRDEASLEGVSDPWRDLAEGLGNPFLTPDWYLAWLHRLGADTEPHVIVVRDGEGELVGLVPLVAERRSRRTVLRFAGADEGDLFHPLSAPADQARVAARAGEALRDHATVVLDRATGSEPWARELTDSLPRHSRIDYRDAPLPYLALGPGGWEGYLASRSRNFRNQVGRKLRALQRDHEVSFRPARKGRTGEDFEILLRLHEDRWRERGGSGAVGGDVTEFQREFARAAERRGWLRFWFLMIDGEEAAGWYGWRIGPRYAYYLSGFSERWADASVGFVLLAHTIRSAFEEGAEVYDFLLGGEAYKARFAEDEREVQTMAFGRRGPASLQLSAEAALWRAGNRLPPGLRARAIGAYRRVSLSGRR